MAVEDAEEGGFDTLLKVFGLAMLEWQYVEEGLFVTFLELTKLDQPVAKALLLG